MRRSAILARLRDFLLLALGSAALLLVVLLVLVRLRFPALTESNLAEKYWILLGVASVVAVSCAALYAGLDPPLSKGPPGV